MSRLFFADFGVQNTPLDSLRTASSDRAGLFGLVQDCEDTLTQSACLRAELELCVEQASLGSIN